MFGSLRWSVCMPRPLPFVLAAGLLLASSTPGAGQTGCVGDCNDDRQVKINELILGVNIAIDQALLTDCSSFNLNGNNQVEVNELVTGVNNALDGCPAVPTATGRATVTLTPSPTETVTVTPTATTTGEMATETPTPMGAATVTPTATTTGEVATETPTPTATSTGTPPPTGSVTATPTATTTGATETPTATVTSTSSPTATTTTSIVKSVAGGAVVAVNGVSAIPNVIGAIVVGIQTGAAAGVLDGGAAASVDNCPISGTVERTGSLLSSLTIDLNNCEVPRPDGSVLFDGVLTVNLTNPLTLSGTATLDAEVKFKNQQGDDTLSTDANLTATVTLRVQAVAAGTACSFSVLTGKAVLTGLAMTLKGPLASTAADGSSVTVTFDPTNGTLADLTINQYGSDCVPSDYVLVLNGMATLSQTTPPPGGSLSFGLTFTSFRIDADVTGVDISGQMTADCFGGPVTLSTVESLQLLTGQFCPEAGQITVQDLGRIFYSNQTVSVDTNNDGTPDQTFDPCTDPALLQCVN